MHQSGKRLALLQPAFHWWIVEETENMQHDTLHFLIEVLCTDTVSRVSWKDSIVYLTFPDDKLSIVEVKNAADPEGLPTVGLDYLQVTSSVMKNTIAMQRLLPCIRSPGRIGLFEKNG